jgi:hypothetical protein
MCGEEEAHEQAYGGGMTKNALEKTFSNVSQDWT